MIIIISLGVDVKDEEIRGIGFYKRDFFINSNDRSSFNDFSAFQNYSYEDNKPFVVYLLKETPARLIFSSGNESVIIFLF